MSLIDQLKSKFYKQVLLKQDKFAKLSWQIDYIFYIVLQYSHFI